MAVSRKNGGLIWKLPLKNKVSNGSQQEEWRTYLEIAFEK